MTIFQLVSCQLDTAHKSVIFQFAPDSDKPNIIAEKLVDQDCISSQHVPPLVEQLERVIQAVKTDPAKIIGLKLISYVDATTGSVDTVVRQMSQDAMGTGSHASVRVLGLFLTILNFTQAGVTIQIFCYSLYFFEFTFFRYCFFIGFLYF